MRVRKGQSLEEVEQALESAEQVALQQAITSEALRTRYENKASKAQDEVHVAVARALRDGVPAALLAARLDVTPARIYQMRDRARELEGGS